MLERPPTASQYYWASKKELGNPFFLFRTIVDLKAAEWADKTMVLAQPLGMREWRPRRAFFFLLFFASRRLHPSNLEGCLQTVHDFWAWLKSLCCSVFRAVFTVIGQRRLPYHSSGGRYLLCILTPSITIKSTVCILNYACAFTVHNGPFQTLCSAPRRRQWLFDLDVLYLKVELSFLFLLALTLCI